MRIRIIVLVAAVLLFGAIITVPRIIEASKSSADSRKFSRSKPGPGYEDTTSQSASRSATTRQRRCAK